MTCPWAQDTPNILRWEMGPRTPGDAAESRAGTEPRQRAGGSVLQRGLCATWGAQEEGTTAGVHATVGAHTGGVRAGDPAAVGKGGPCSH